MAPELFISYSRKDRAIVYPLVERLQRYFRVWIDQLMHAGEFFPDTLAQRIAESAGVLVFLSPDSVASDWVKQEISTAQAHRRKIIPYLLSSCSVPAGLAHINYIDHANPDAFGLLLDTLHIETPQARHHPGVASDLQRAGDAPSRLFANTAQQVEGALQLDNVGTKTLVGLPVCVRRHHVIYLVGFGADTIERQDVLQVALQATGAFPGDDMPHDIAKFVVGQTPETPLRLAHIRGPMKLDSSDRYDYDTAYPEEWMDAVNAVYWVVTQLYGRQPERVQIFIKAPAVIAMQIGLNLGKLARNIQFELQHLNEETGKYVPIFV